MVDDFRSLVAVYDEDGRTGGVRAQEWFLPKKRTLLAEHAVGTIDQALLGVLRTRHGFVRLYGLAGKTVILDEVHAYDTFTSTILERLVEWFGALGTTVVLLSATLPSTRRRALLAAYRKGAGGSSEIALDDAQYPRLTTVTSVEASSVHFVPRSDPVTVEIARIDPDVAKIAEVLIGHLHDGGCAGWICNTVNRAQAAYEAIARIDPSLPRLLLHARMLPEDRAEREQRLETLLGPESRGARRPERHVVVGTQVLEQSLDVDFDFLVTDLAPIDLLLQRAGRLHRHRDRSNRSAAHPRPRLRIAYGDGAFHSISIHAVAKVYAEALVRGTLRALQGRTRLTLPDDIEPLIEEVYRGTPPETDDELFGPYIDLFGGSIAQRQNAQVRLLPRPTDQDDIFGNLRMPFSDDEDPQVHEELLAITRDAERSVQVVCLVGRDGQVFVFEDDTVPILLDLVPDRTLAARLARRTISMSHRKLVPELLSNPVPPGWQERALLRHRRAVVFTERVAIVAGVRLELHPELGLIIGQPLSEE
jgi:CRISPR-associated endonuclease/helicase Cas3